MTEPRPERKTLPIKLETLAWTVVDPAHEPKPALDHRRHEVAKQVIPLGDRTATLVADHIGSETDPSELFIFTIIDDHREVLKVILQLMQGVDYVTVTSNIAKVSDSHFPGTTLYGLALDYIQHLANQRHKTMTHYVKRSPGETALGRQVLPMDQWTAKFKPLLLQRGYSETGPGGWKKEYRVINHAT